jgi:hypothetical protein
MLRFQEANAAEKAIDFLEDHYPKYWAQLGCSLTSYGTPNACKNQHFHSGQK